MLEKHRVEQNLKIAVKYLGPFGNESQNLESLHIHAPVFVYSKRSKFWESLFELISFLNEALLFSFHTAKNLFCVRLIKPMDSTLSGTIYFFTAREYATCTDSTMNWNCKHDFMRLNMDMLPAMFPNVNLGGWVLSHKHDCVESRKRELLGSEIL